MSSRGSKKKESKWEKLFNQLNEMKSDQQREVLGNMLATDTEEFKTWCFKNTRFNPTLRKYELER